MKKISLIALGMYICSLLEAAPVWVSEKKDGKIAISDPADLKQTMLTISPPRPYSLKDRKQNRCVVECNLGKVSCFGSYGIDRTSENSFDFAWDFDGEWNKKLGSGAIFFLLDPSLRGKNLFFCESGGREEILTLPTTKKVMKWLRPPFNRKMVKRIEIPFSSGVLILDHIDREIACMISGYANTNLRILPRDGKFSGRITVSYQPYRSTPLDFSSVANRGFIDEVEGDGKGGWTDQGKQQDLSSFKEKHLTAEKVRFDIAQGKNTCIVLGKQFKGTLKEAKLTAGSQTFDWLYLLHAAAWCGKKGEQVGIIEIIYSDDSVQRIPVRNKIDVNNWWGDGKDQENWQRAWSAASKDGMNFGIGISRFALQNKSVKTITFHAGEKSMWMIVGATGVNGKGIHFAPNQEKETPEIPLSIKPGKDWKIYRYEHGVIPGSILDFSSLASPVPAGTYGRVVIRNGHFEFEKIPGKPVRFYGTNASSDGNFLDEKLTDYYTQRLRQFGMNALRIHHYDNELVMPGSKIVFNEDNLDRFFRQIAAFKKAGFYLTLDLYTSRRNGLPEKYAKADPFSVKILAQFDPEMKQNMLDFARGLLTRRNPYTGMTLAEDPALIGVALMNEVQLIGNSEVKYNSSIPLLREPVNTAWKAWCKKNDIPMKENPTDSEWAHFALDTLKDGLEFYRSELRKMGVTAPVSQNNNGFPLITAGARRCNDYFDIHYYWAHPNADVGFGNRNPSYSRINSSIMEYWESPLIMARHRIAGMPAIVTEYHYCAPNQYRSEGGAVGGAFAAWQDFDGIFDFNMVLWNRRYPNVLGNGQKIIDRFYGLRDPINLFSQYIFSCFYKRGDIRPAEKEFHLNLPEKIWEDSNLNPLLSRNQKLMEKRTPSPAYVCLGVLGKLSLQFKEGKKASYEFVHEDFLTAECLKNPDTILRKLGGISKDGWIHTPGGQIAFHPKRNMFRAVTEKSEALVQDKGMDNIGKLLKVSGNTTFSTVFAGSADNRSLANSRRILILHLTDVKPSKDKWGIQGNQLKQYHHTPHGTDTYPHLLRIGQAKITLKTPLAETGKLYAVNQNGKRIAEIPFRKVEDGLEFSADTGFKDGIMAYELTED